VTVCPFFGSLLFLAGFRGGTYMAEFNNKESYPKFINQRKLGIQSTKVMSTGSRLTCGKKEGLQATTDFHPASCRGNFPWLCATCNWQVLLNFNDNTIGRPSNQ